MIPRPPGAARCLQRRGPARGAPAFSALDATRSRRCALTCC